MTPEQIGSSYDFWIVVRRWMATWIDNLLFLALLGLLATAGQRQPVAAVVTFLVFGALYYPLLEGLAGVTLGKLLCGLRVVDADGQRPGVLKGILRTLGRLVDINPLLMGGLPAAIAVMTTRGRQRLGDMLAKTWVLKTEDLPFLGAPAPTPNVPWELPAATQWTPDPSAPAAYPGYGYPTQGYPGEGYPGQGYPGQGYAALGYPPQGYPPAPPPARMPPLPTVNRTWPVPGALLATLGTVALIWWGIADGKRVEAQPPVTLSFAELGSKGLHEGYYRITGAQLPVENAVYLPSNSASGSDETGTDKPEEFHTIFVPVRKAGDTSGKPTSLVLQTDNEQDVKTLRTMSKLTDATIEPWLLKHGAEAEVRRDLRGTVQGEFFGSEVLHEQIAKGLGKQVTPNFVILKEGDTPTPVASIFAIIAGVFSGVLSAVFWLVCLINLASTPSPRRAA